MSVGDYRGVYNTEQSAAITNAAYTAVGTVPAGALRAWVDLHEDLTNTAFVKVGSGSGAPLIAGASYVLYDADEPLKTAMAVTMKLGAAGPSTAVLRTIIRQVP